MGAIMCMGVATANSILVVSFAKERLAHHQRCAAGRDRSRLHALPARADDRAGHDHRHDPDGARPGRRRRTECAAGPRGDRRPAVRDGRDSVLRAGRVQLCSHGHAKSRVTRNRCASRELVATCISKDSKENIYDDRTIQQEPKSRCACPPSERRLRSSPHPCCCFALAHWHAAGLFTWHLHAGRLRGERSGSRDA